MTNESSHDFNTSAAFRYLHGDHISSTVPYKPRGDLFHFANSTNYLDSKYLATLNSDSVE